MREFFNSFGYDEKENVNEDLIKKVSEVNSWRKGEESFDEKPEKPERNQQMNKRQSVREKNEGGQTQFQKGANYKPTPPPELVKKPTFTIEVGKN